MTRRLVRRISFVLVYQLEFHETFDMLQAANWLLDEIKVDSELQEWLELEGMLTEKNCEFVLHEGKGIVEHIAAIDGMIAGSLLSWHMDRVAKTDLAVIRLAVYESFFSDLDIIPRVATNEAVELAKIFGGDGSAAFVNGVLRRVFQVNQVEL